MRFRTAELRRYRYDEALNANEDYDLCRRMHERRRRSVWLETGWTCDYEPRATVAGRCGAQYAAFGRSKIALLARTRTRPAPPAGLRLVAAGTGALLGGRRGPVADGRRRW